GHVARVARPAIGRELRQDVRVGLESVRETVEAELFDDAGVPHVRLCLELLGGLIVLLLLPVHGDLGYADLGQLLPVRRTCHGICLLGMRTAVLVGARGWR